MGITGLGSQTRPCLRITLAILCVTLITSFYFLNNVSNVTYTDFEWNLKTDFNYTDYFSLAYTSENIDNQSFKEGYLVYSPSCKLPDIDPYHESIRGLIKKVNLIKCTKLPPLTKIVGDQLVYNKYAEPKYAHKSKMNCYYQSIYRPPMEGSTNPNPDDVFNMTPCIQFDKTIYLKDTEEYILVKCTVPKLFAGTTEVYSNVHGRIIKKQSVEEKLKQNKTIDNQLSVLLIGIDSISRSNMIRTMPNTVKLLKELNFIDLRGYNKIGDNTFPNLVAILTGMSYNDLMDLCWGGRDKVLDKCPFIWYNASRLGYVTAYAEDEPTIGSFNFQKKGFKIQPTDYYFRSLMMAAEKYLKITSIDNLKICLGPTLTADYLINYCKEFVERFKNDLYFALIWMNTFSHNNMNAPSAMDKKIHQFFKDMFMNVDHLNSTAIIFLSDHGMRFGEIRNTYVGWLEERLPYIYIWLPEWYKNKFKNRYDNLIYNRNRLTSPYDLHLTIRDLIIPPGSEEYESSKNYTSIACPDCRSLFAPVPWDRTCAEAGITAHWCTCSEYRTLSTEGALVRSMVHYAVRELNNLLINSANLTTTNMKCAELSVKSVLTVRSKLYDKPIGHDDYVIVFETLPGAGMFETTIRHDKTYKILDSISRINAYYNQSSCMHDAGLRKFCYCIKS